MEPQPLLSGPVLLPLVPSLFSKYYLSNSVFIFQPLHACAVALIPAPTCPAAGQDPGLQFSYSPACADSALLLSSLVWHPPKHPAALIAQNKARFLPHLGQGWAQPKHPRDWPHCVHTRLPASICTWSSVCMDSALCACVEERATFPELSDMTLGPHTTQVGQESCHSGYADRKTEAGEAE